MFFLDGSRVRFTLAYCVLLGSSAQATNYYVSTSGNNSNPGTLAQPWRNVSYAVGSGSPASAGDTIFVHAGTYNEYIQMGKSGTAGHPITLTGVPGEARPVLSGGGALGNILVTGQGNWTIDGFEIRDSNGGAGIFFDDAGNTNGSTWIIQNNIIHNTDSGDNASCILITRRLGTFIIRNNVMYDCNGTSVPGNNVGIVIFGHINPGFPGNASFQIQNNEIYNENVAVKVKHPFPTDQTVNVDISYNLFHDIGGKAAFTTSGGRFTAGKTNRVHHNVIYAAPSDPGVNVGDDFDEYGVEVDHNTMYNVGKGVSICLADGCSAGGSLNENVHDNVIVAASGGYGMWTEMTSTPFSTSDYNCFWNVNPTTTMGNWGGYNGSPETLAQWQGHGLDAHSVRVDPMFVNAAGGNFHLQSGSACKNLRGNGQDPGAYETGGEVIGVNTGALIPPPPPPTFFSRCDVNQDGAISVLDIQIAANQAMGASACVTSGQPGTADINADLECNVIDVQRVMNYALGGSCVAP